MKKNLLFLMSLIWTLFPGLLNAQSGYVPQVGDKITTDDGIYVVSGSNLISNPNFDEGFADWKAGDNSDLSDANFQIVEDGGPDGSPCLKALGSAGSGSAKSIKKGWEVEVGKTYVFSCWAYRSQVDGNAQYSRLYSSDSETGTNSEMTKIQYKAGQWNQTEYVFTASRPYVVANFGWLNSVTMFDSFSLNELTISNELATAKLEEQIATAQNLLATTEEGTGKGQYTTEVRNVLSAAISAAQGVLSRATTQEEINNAVTVLAAAVAKYKSEVNPPFELGVGYVFTNVAAGINLSTADGTVRINNKDAGDPKQEFYFERAPEGSAAEGYNLRDKEGVYVYRSGSWDTKASPDADRTIANAIFTIVDMGDYVQIKNAGSGSVLGVDNTTDNSAVYSNKNGTDSRYCWIMMKNTPTAALEALISTAEELLANTDVGSEYYQVPQSAADALLSAINTAKSALSTITTPEDGQAAVGALQSAIDTFNGSFNPLTPFSEGETYIIKHSGGMLLTYTESGNASITAMPEDGATQEQLMTFEKVTVSGYENAYYLKSVSSDTYLRRDGQWNTLWTENNDTVAAIFTIDKLDGKYLGIKFASTNSYLGTDATSSGSLTYSDKAGSGYRNSYWTIEPYVTVVLDRVAWNAALEAANDALNNAVDGYGEGEFFTEDINAFRTVIATARSNANKSKDQETLDAVTAQLVTDTEAFLQKAHSETLVDKRELAKTITSAQTALSGAVAGDLNGQYPQESINGLSGALASANGVNNNASATQKEVDDANSSLQLALSAFNDEKVKIDYSQLNAAISDAQKALKDAEGFIGEGAGKFTQANYDKLSNAMKEAQDVIKNNSKNQGDVNTLASELASQTTEFINSRAPMDIATLQGLIEQASALIAQAENGEVEYIPEDLETLKASVAKAEEKLTSVDQDDIDKAAKILRRDIDIFKIGMQEAVGIDELLMQYGSELKIYNLNGQRVNNPGRGIYIVNGKKVVVR